ncbi:MAG: hypothetical protein WC443_04985 [Desulfobaccales bacterium]
MGRRNLNLWNILLLAGIALLFLATINLWWNTKEPPAQSRADKGPQVPTAPRLRDEQPLNQFTVVASKNLFSPERTGPSPEGGAGKGQNTLEGRQLMGIMIVGNTRAALIGGKNVKKPGEAVAEVVFLGDQWGDFKVLEIANNVVVFLGKEGKVTLNFPE